MELAGKKVYHKVFKLGIITKLENKCIYVKFETQADEKRFVYPDCFKSFLQLIDTDVKNVIAEDMSKAETDRVRIKSSSSQSVIKNTALFFQTKCTPSARNAVSQSFKVPRFTSVSDFVDYYNHEIVKEISYIRENGGKHITVFDGRFLEKQGNRYFYIFESDSELNYQSGTQITVYISNGIENESKISALLEDCTENTVYISTEHDFGHLKNTEISSLEFSVEAWFLLNSLNERLNVLKNNTPPLVYDLITQGFNNIQYDRNIVTGQDTAVEMSVDQPITFIWGPPGTGKTETLAKIAVRHMKMGHKILMLSYSNVSVDGAIQRVFKMIPNTQNGKILRYGYPKDTDINNSKYKSSYNYTLYNNKELFEKIEEINKHIKGLKKWSDEYKKFQNELVDIRKQIKEQEIIALKQSNFIATTVSKAVIDKKLTEISFDVVIFDEASMSYIPQIVFGASLAKMNFICMGDFCQLPPIVQGDHTEALAVDIFKFCGICDAVEHNVSHKWLCMLNTQYRMHPDIAEIANVLMYHNLLKTGDDVKEKREAINKSLPELQKAYGIVDLSYMMSTCISTNDHSRINILSAFISFALAQKSADNDHSVGIITPYSSQASLLRCMSADRRELNSYEENILCATVHQFQGMEKDIIIYDSTDCYRQSFPGIMLTSKRENYANKLFNVAMTRAKGKFVLVTNAKFMTDKGVKSDLMFGRIIQQSKKFSNIDGEQLCKFSFDNCSYMKFYDPHKAKYDFFSDLKMAKNMINIDIPFKPEENDVFYNKLANIFEQVKKKGVKLIIRAEKRRSIPKQILPYTIEYGFAINPIVVIDKSITWYGLPYSAADFITENGTIETKYYPIIRFKGKKTARKIYGLLEMNKTIDQSKEILFNEEVHTFAQYILKSCKCSKCGNSMQLKKGRQFFVACTNYPACSNTERLTVELLTEYIFSTNKTGLKCAKCGYSLEAKSGRYGIYACCCGLAKHTYKLDEI